MTALAECSDAAISKVRARIGKIKQKIAERNAQIEELKRQL